MMFNPPEDNNYNSMIYIFMTQEYKKVYILMRITQLNCTLSIDDKYTNFGP